MFSMMTEEEQRYLYEFAKDHYVGEGAIVDLGCWLGSSTVSFAKGLQANPRPELRNSKIHSFDLFQWDTSMNLFRQDAPLNLAQGESFLPEYLKQIEPWKHQVQIYEGDLQDYPWTAGAIEFLFIDAMKSWELANSIIQKYFGSLIPGRSIVYHQDYCFHGTYWIHLTMDRLRDYFEPIYDVPNAWGYVFKLKKPIPDSLLSTVYSLNDFSLEDLDRAFSTALHLVSNEKKSQIIGAKVLALMNLNQFDRARAELETAYLNGLSVSDLQIPLGLGFPILVMHHCLARQTEQQQIQALQAKIEAMERSKFWKLRSLWQKMKPRTH